MVILFLGFCSLVRGVWSFTMAIKTEYESILGSTEQRRQKFDRRARDSIRLRKSTKEERKVERVHNNAARELPDSPNFTD